MFQPVFDGSGLVVVRRQDFLGQNLHQLLLVAPQVLGQVVAELRLQGLEFGLGLVVIAFEAGQFLQVLQVLFRVAGVGIAAVHHPFGKRFIVGVGQFEVLGRGHRRMFGDVVHDIVEQQLARIARHVGAGVQQTDGQVRQGVGLHLHVGRDTAAIFHHPAACRAELFGQRIGHMLRVAAVVVLVVDGLYAASAGYVVLVGGQFQAAVVGHGHGHLHQSLAIGARSHDDRTVQILQAAARDLARTGRFAVHQHHDGHDGVYRFHRRPVVVVHAFQASAVRNDQLSLGHEHVHKAHSLLFYAAAVAPQVEHELLHALSFQVEERPPHLLGAAFRELVQVDVAHAVLPQAVVGHRRELYGAARHLDFHHLSRAGPAYLDDECGARVAPQTVAHIAVVPAFHRLVVDGQYHIALLQARFGGWHVGVWLFNHHVFPGEVVAYERADAGIFARHHHLEVAFLLGRIVLRIGVERAEHGVDSRADGHFRVERIYIEQVQLLVDGIENIQVFHHLEAMVVLLLGCDGQGQDKQHTYYILSHLH